jgi:hypothetical protein
MKKVTSKDGYTSYHAEEVLFIELPAWTFHQKTLYWSYEK